MKCSEVPNVVDIMAILKKCCISNKISLKDEENFHNYFESLLSSCSIKGLNQSEDIPYSEKDFEFIACKVLPELQIMHRVLEKVLLNETLYLFSFETIKKVVLGSLLLCSQFQNSICFWSDEKCSYISLKIIELLLSFSNCERLESLLVGNKNEVGPFDKLFPNGVLKLLLTELSLNFTKTKWKKYPSYIEAYEWILYNVKAPHLAEYVTYFLPPSLFILDDWEKRNKIIGAKALYHILENTPSSEIRWYGRSEVIFQALQHNLYSREPDVLQNVYPAAILAASVIEKDQVNDSKVKKSRYDAVLDHLLREMAHEEKLKLRTVYASAFKLLMGAMGISIIRWSTKVLNVCADYLETYEGEMAQDRIAILEALHIYIKNCWPRIHHSAKPILKMVLKLAYEISLKESPPVKNQEDLLLRSKGIVDLLFAAAPQTVNDLCLGLESLEMDEAKNIKFIISGLNYKEFGLKCENDV